MWETDPSLSIPPQAGGGVERAPSPQSWDGVESAPSPGERGRVGRGRAGGYSAAAATGSPSRTPRTAYSAATLIASIMLTALARPVPAMSNAVP
jgi:hypothetical protein